MKKKGISFWLCSAVLIFGCRFAQAASDPGGFMGLKWSQTVQDCKRSGMCSNETIPLTSELKGENTLRGTQKEMAGLPLYFSSFAFYNNQFYQGVVVLKPGGPDFDDLRKVLVAKHGKPRTEGPKWASWQLGKTRITLSGEEKTCGAVYLHEPTFKTVAKLKGIPLSAPGPAAAPAPKKTPKKN